MVKINMETFAQKMAQSEDGGIYSATYDFNASPSDKFLDDIANNTPNASMFNTVKKKSKKKKHQVINIDNYERYWDNSTPNGHQIRIVCQDDSTLHINLNWPKGYNPRIRDVDERNQYGQLKETTQRVKRTSKSKRGNKK